MVASVISVKCCAYMFIIAVCNIKYMLPYLDCMVVGNNYYTAPVKVIKCGFTCDVMGS